jgi:hypothetical protein
MSLPEPAGLPLAAVPLAPVSLPVDAAPDALAPELSPPLPAGAPVPPLLAPMSLPVALPEPAAGVGPPEEAPELEVPDVLELAHPSSPAREKIIRPAEIARPRVPFHASMMKAPFGHAGDGGARQAAIVAPSVIRRIFQITLSKYCPLHVRLEGEEGRR